MATIEKLQTGVVVSTKMDKTVIVRVDRSKRHRLYGKTMHTSQRYKAHDETNECNLGDIVRISETRPLSREKRWRVVEVVHKGDVAEIAPTEVGSSQLQELTETQAAEAARRAEEERQKTAAKAAEDAEAHTKVETEAAPEAAPPAEASAEASTEEAASSEEESS
jgi:small subunit ribosomal protein S17